MSADSYITESLSRIEHKQDLILEILANAFGSGNSFFTFTPVGDKNHICPVCTQNVRYSVDVINAIVTRLCGCKTGMIALDLKSFAPPTPETKQNDDRQQSDEDWSNSRSGRRTRKR